MPSERVRKMEIRANEAFDVYRELYYEGGVSSVYFWNLDDGFAGVVLLKKGMTALQNFRQEGVMLILGNRGNTSRQKRRNMGFNPRLRSRRSRSYSPLQTYIHRYSTSINN